MGDDDILPEQPIEPALDQCVTYISARGFDRVQVLFEWTLLALVRGKKIK